MRINENIFSSSFVQDCSIILAGKCDRVASVSLNKNAVVVETIKLSNVRGFIDEEPTFKTSFTENNCVHFSGGKM